MRGIITTMGVEHITKKLDDFLDEESNSDLDMNLVFRWDWLEEDGDGKGTYQGDDYYRNGRLLIFFMGQRKGLYRWADVEVCRADEPRIREYLQPRWQHIKTLWQPISEKKS